MQIVTQPAPSDTFNATQADIEDIIGRAPDTIDKLRLSIARGSLDFGSAVAPPAPSASKSNPQRAIALATTSGHTFRHDPAAAVAFLKWLDPNGWHTLWVQHPETDANTGRTFAPNSWDEIAVFVNAQQGRNVYFTANEPKRDAPNKKPRKEHIENVRAVWGDFDPDEDLEMAGKGAAERKRLEALTAALLADGVAPPSFIIDSGGGYQALWRLDKKLSADEFGKQCEEQTKGILARFGGDKSVWNLDRVLRIPGTVNFPDAKKRARGRVTRQATLVAQNNRRYGLEVLAGWTAPVPTNTSTTDADKRLDIDWNAAREAVSYEELPAALRQKFEKYCVGRPAVKLLWEGEREPGDGTPSTFVYALAGHLRGPGTFTPFEYVQLVNVWAHQSIKHEDDFERYVSRAWNNNRTPLGGAGFDPVEIDESKAPSVVPNNNEVMRKPEAARSKLYSLSYDAAADLALSNSTEPLIEGLLDRSAMSVWYGKSGTGKTFIVLDAAWHIATGRAWGGMLVRQGLVIFVAAEGGQSINKRIGALRRHYPDAGEVPLHIVPCPVDLLRPAAGHLDQLIALIKGIEAKTGLSAELIVIDTLSRALAGGDENGSVDMGAFVSNLDVLRAATAAHLAIVHHAGKDTFKGARGHSLLRAATDTEIKVAPNKIEATKQRDVETGQSIAFKLKPIRVGMGVNGKEVKSCYVELRVGQAPEPMPLTNEAQTFATALNTALITKYDKNPADAYLQPFRTKFAVECAAGLSPENARVHSRAFRASVQRWMNEMREKAHLKKLKRGQWLLVDAQNAQTCTQ